MSGEQLRERMDTLNMTTGELARELEVSPATVWRWQRRGMLDKVTSLACDVVLGQLERAHRRRAGGEGARDD
jgi:hypothetical protein